VVDAAAAQGKQCTCGRTYDVQAWNRLAYVGLQDDGEQVLELRVCVCGATIAALVGPSPGAEQPFDVAPSSAWEILGWRVRVESGTDPVLETEYMSELAATTACQHAIRALDVEHGGRVVMTSPQGRVLVNWDRRPRRSDGSAASRVTHDPGGALVLTAEDEPEKKQT